MTFGSEDGMSRSAGGALGVVRVLGEKNSDLCWRGACCASAVRPCFCGWVTQPCPAPGGTAGWPCGTAVALQDGCGPVAVQPAQPILRWASAHTSGLAQKTSTGGLFHMQLLDGSAGVDGAVVTEEQCPFRSACRGAGSALACGGAGAALISLR